MTKKYRLLLHIGLPKTATTSFQLNVCRPLHREGRINYLGVSRTLTSVTYYPLARFNHTIVKKKLTHDEASRLRVEIEKHLSADKLNVVSEENFSVSMIYDLDTVFYNLSRIFCSCDIKLMVSLRSSFDLFFSQYVETYGRRFHYDKNRNTLEKFAASVLSHPDAKAYSAFFHEDYLQLVDQYFEHKTVLLFEDLKHDQQHYFSLLANLMGMNQEDVTARFLSKTRNTKITTVSGKSSHPVTLGMLLRHKLNFLKNTSDTVLGQSAWRRYLWQFMIAQAHRIKVGEAVEHSAPNAALSEKLFELLGLKDVDSFCDKHGLNHNKLIRYGYAKNNQASGNQSHDNALENPLSTPPPPPDYEGG